MLIVGIQIQKIFWIFLGSETGNCVLSQIAFHRWVPTPFMTRAEGWLYKTVLFLTIKNDMTISLSLSEVGVTYKLTDGKKNMSLFISSFNYLSIHPTFTKHDIHHIK